MFLLREIATPKGACLLESDISSGGTLKTSRMADARLQACNWSSSVLVARMSTSNIVVDTFVPFAAVPSESQGHRTLTLFSPLRDIRSLRQQLTLSAAFCPPISGSCEAVF